jgi:hypothetical protein
VLTAAGVGQRRAVLLAAARASAQLTLIAAAPSGRNSNTSAALTSHGPFATTVKNVLRSNDTVVSRHQSWRYARPPCLRESFVPADLDVP